MLQEAEERDGHRDAAVVRAPPLSGEEKRWCAAFVTCQILAQICLGAANTVMGPSQPYLARNAGVGIDAVNFVWTWGILGFLPACLLAGFVFKRCQHRPALL